MGNVFKATGLTLPERKRAEVNNGFGDDPKPMENIFAGEMQHVDVAEGKQARRESQFEEVRSLKERLLEPFRTGAMFVQFMVRRLAFELPTVVAVVVVGLGIWVLASEFRRNYVPALLGRAKSQYLVAAAYKRGQSPQNYAKAARWFKRAADKGFPEADFEYGVLRLNGLGIEQDREEALDYLSKAADSDILEAQFLLGATLLNDGSDSQRAEQQLRQAAEKRYAPAQYCLANEYIAGARLPQNYVAAYVLLNDLARQTDLDNQKFLPAVRLRDYLWDFLMSRQEQAQTQEWLESHPRASN
jgi:hypothetical protein